MLLAFLLACNPAPDPCEAMCAAAADLYGTCLESWALDWSAAGYEDQADFLDRCETWAWEARLLEADAGQDGAVDAACEERELTFGEALDPLTCEAYTTIAWEEMPWE